MKLITFPELRQIYNYDCGACAVACCLAAYGINVREDFIMQIAGTTEDGTNTAGVIKIFDYFGLKTRSGEMTIADLRKYIFLGFPTMLALQAYGDPRNYAVGDNDGHWVVAIGRSKLKTYFEDPSAYTRTFLSDPELNSRWHDVDEGERKIQRWGCTILQKPTFCSGSAVHMD